MRWGLRAIVSSSIGEWKQRTKNYVLDNDALGPHLRLVHFDKPRVDLLPAAVNLADVEQHGRMLSKASFLDHFDEAQRRRVQILFGQRVEFGAQRKRDHPFRSRGLGINASYHGCCASGGVLVIASAELRRAPEKGEKTVVVETPDAVRPGGLEHILVLEAPCDVQVLSKHVQYEHRGRLGIGVIKVKRVAQTPEKHHKGAFVTAPVVYAGPVPEGLLEVCAQLLAYGRNLARAERASGVIFDQRAQHLWGALA
mmetsp:Transcript_10090/g.26952  ORF Transcript_10090/g.26952 Transcript_10090/m.26952 type:complete len:254 (+) Transcript_10090:1364-2125(+)